jgi:hypothetical protein
MSDLSAYLHSTSAQHQPQPLADLLRRVRAEAEVVEGGISDLDAVLNEFGAGDVPDQIWNIAANVSMLLEIAISDILGAIEDLDAAISAR